jgi:transposase
VRRQIRRAQLLQYFAKLPACLVGIEACASAHHWARELGALGHKVRLMPASYVKPYVKRQKAAWIGLVPKQNSSGGKERLGGITKQGDPDQRERDVRNTLPRGRRPHMAQPRPNPCHEVEGRAHTHCPSSF